MTLLQNPYFSAQNLGLCRRFVVTKAKKREKKSSEINKKKPLTSLRNTLADLVGNHPKLVSVGFGLA